MVTVSNLKVPHLYSDTKTALNSISTLHACSLSTKLLIIDKNPWWILILIDFFLISGMWNREICKLKMQMVRFRDLQNIGFRLCLGI